MTTNEIQKILEENSPFLIFTEPHAIEWVFKDDILFMDDKPYSKYTIEEGNFAYNITFTDKSVSRLSNCVVRIKAPKQILVNYEPERLKERVPITETDGSFTLYPKGKLPVEKKKK